MNDNAHNTKYMRILGTEAAIDLMGVISLSCVNANAKTKITRRKNKI